MSRRVSLPGASELFRPTSSTAEEAEPLPDLVEQAPQDSPEPKPEPAPARRSPRKTTARRTAPAKENPAPATKTPARRSTKAAAAQPSAEQGRAASGRIRHDEKITVYVSSEELLALEQARLTLRAEHGLAVDRGRIVRESVALVMADLAAHGADSDLVRRLEAE